MALNIFPKRKEQPAAPAPEPEMTLPEPSPELLDEPRKKTRRGSRGGRGRTRPAGAPSEPGLEGEAAFEAEAEVIGAAPVARVRRPRVPKAPVEALAEVEAVAEAEPAHVPAARRTRKPVVAPVAAADVEEAPAPAAAPVHRGGRAAAAPADASTAGILRAIEQQGRQIEQLVRLQEAAARGGGGGVATQPARVGIFVDAANVELGLERSRARVDWGKVLELLTRGRQLVRAVAYSPVHDDPTVSIETQRFVEPFLDKGYKVVTKPLKRFADNTVKANVDIEMALDIITMLDRLDVVCLVSGDGDFQRLVELIQSKGVRVEVIAVASSTATNLRHAADHYIDLQSRLRDIRL
ncbi:MAG: NYN domain-containing protein [Chloroflexi bacterium]|nr:NYN domain-containing protein [Chloroflexota bacterium]